MQNNAYQLEGKDGATIAILVVTSTHSGAGSSVKFLSDRCPEPRSKYFTNDFESNQTSARKECLVVNPNFGPHNFYKPDSQFMNAVREKNIKLFRSGYSLRSVAATPTGTQLHVNLMTLKTFKGLVGKTPAAAQTREVPSELVAWGEALHDAVKNSVFSVSGKLVLPPIEFKD